MRAPMTICKRSIPSLMALALAYATPAATFAGGPGGGGGKATNPFVGSWAGGAYTNSLIRYDFTFTKDFKFTLVESLYATGEVTARLSGTYVLGGFGPDGFPLITMFSQGQILLQEEYSGAFEGIALRGTIFLVIARL
jgi:hypothetical protein